MGETKNYSELLRKAISDLKSELSKIGEVGVIEYSIEVPKDQPDPENITIRISAETFNKESTGKILYYEGYINVSKLTKLNPWTISNPEIYSLNMKDWVNAENFCIQYLTEVIFMDYDWLFGNDLPPF